MSNIYLELTIMITKNILYTIFMKEMNIKVLYSFPQDISFFKKNMLCELMKILILF